jgi:hypothetical protein
LRAANPSFRAPSSSVLMITVSNFSTDKKSMQLVHGWASIFRHTSLSQTFHKPIGVGQPFRTVRQCAMHGSQLSDCFD